MDCRCGGRWLPWMPGIVGAAVAAAAVAAGTVPVATTATIVSAAATVAASPPPLDSAREAPALLPPSVRALDVQSIGNVTYKLVVQVNGSTCPSTFSMGAGAPVTGVPPTAARLYPANNIRQGSGACVGDGLLAVPVETLLIEATMASLGEPGVAATLTGSDWSKLNVGWATAVGLRADSWRCNGFDPWPVTVVAYFSDARRDIRTSLQEATTVLRAGQRHLLFANTVSMHCIMSAPAPDEVIEVGGQDGGGTSKGAIIGGAVAAFVALVAAAATAVVAWKMRRRGAASAGNGQGEEAGWEGGAVTPPPSPPSPPFYPGVTPGKKEDRSGGPAPWAPCAPAPPPAGTYPPYTPPAVPPPPPPPAAGKNTINDAGGGGGGGGGWAPPPAASLGSTLTMTPPGSGWNAAAYAAGGAAGGGGGVWGGADAGRWDAARGDRGEGGGGGRPDEPLTPPPMPKELRSVS